MIKKLYNTIILSFLILLIVYVICYGDEPVTCLKNNNEFTRVFTSQQTEALESGTKVKRNVNGEWVHIKRMKACEYAVEQGEDNPGEDADEDGNTDYIIKRMDTDEQIAKEITNEKNNVIVCDYSYDVSDKFGYCER